MVAVKEDLMVELRTFTPLQPAKYAGTNEYETQGYHLTPLLSSQFVRIFDLSLLYL